MHSLRSLTRIAPAIALILVVGACDNAAADLSTTSSLVSGTNATGGSTTTSVEPGGQAATTTLVGESVSGYQIVARESAVEGETLYIVIPTGAYTDIDIENFVVDLVESGTATYGAEIFNDAAAVDAFRKEAADRTEDEETLIENHHLASLVNGSTIVFQGPFATSGQMTIGS